MKNEDEPGLLEELTSKWKTASGGEKVKWLAIALLVAYLARKFEQSWHEVMSKRK